MTTSSDRLSTTTCLAYGAPTFAERILIAPVLGILPALYAAHTGMPLALLGTIFLASRLIDAFTDPLIGYLSDITRSRFGARKPWIACGTLVLALATLFLYTPSPSSNAFYFGFWSVGFFLGWTMLVIPYNAWATEITGDYFERSRLFAYRNWIGSAGGLLFAASPYFLSHWTGSTEYSLELLRVVALVMIVVLPISTAIALYKAPTGAGLATEQPSLRGLADAMKNNRVMWLFLSVTLIGAVGQGTYGALEFLYISNQLQLGTYYYQLAIVQGVVGLAAISFCLKLVALIGKHVLWSGACFLLAVFLPGHFLLQPGESALPFLFAYATVLGLTNAVAAVSPQSMLADVIDYDNLKTGVNRAGNYFALLTLLSKASLAIGSGFGMIAIGLFGYDLNQENSTESIRGLLLVFALFPTLCFLANGFLLLKYPLDERRQRIIHKRIEQRAERILG